MVDLLDADGLAGEGSTEIDFLTIETEPAATGDHDGAVMKRVVRRRDALIGTDRSSVQLSRTLHRERFVRPFVIELMDEGIELGLLLKHISAGGSSGLLLESQVHALVSAVLLGMTGLDAFDRDSQVKPPDRELRKVEEPVGRSKRHTVMGTDGARQPPFFEKTLKCNESGQFAIGFHSLTQQQIARGEGVPSARVRDRLRRFTRP